MVFAGSTAREETLAHVLFILEAQMDHTSLEQQEIDREWEGPGAIHSWYGR